MFANLGTVERADFQSFSYSRLRQSSNLSLIVPTSDFEVALRAEAGTMWRIAAGNSESCIKTVVAVVSDVALLSFHTTLASASLTAALAREGMCVSMGTRVVSMSLRFGRLVACWAMVGGESSGTAWAGVG